MAVGFYFHPASMTTQQYDQIMQRLDQAGAAHPKGRLFHSCFGEGSQLSVYDIWESQADFDAFGPTLMPVLQSLGVDPGTPDVVPIHNFLNH